jgi:membrane associated rhomboid family serine protease
MIPLRDENATRIVPVVTIGLIVANALLFFYQLSLGAGLRAFVFEWAMVPLRLTLAIERANEPVLVPGLTFLTSMFLHGSFVHLIGNMWYLWIFGDNVEDRMGRVRFLAFYLLSGLVAAALHFVLHADSRLPTLGASGAIAGVLGAYLRAFPRARIITLVPLFPFFQILALPAVIVLGLWFVFQFLSGFIDYAWTRGGGGVAWWSHIGGFAFGMLAGPWFGMGRRERA